MFFSICSSRPPLCFFMAVRLKSIGTAMKSPSQRDQALIMVPIKPNRAVIEYSSHAFLYFYF